MTSSSAPPRTPRGEDTRSLIIEAAERLFAEHGVAAVSNRQICEAAGQANNSVIAYHFGTRTDLVRAIIGRHQADIEQRRALMLGSAETAGGLRTWVDCLVRPITEHYAALDQPSWYARFAAQVTTDPALRDVVIDDVMALPSMQRPHDQLTRLLPALPRHVRRQRTDMGRLLIVHLCAEMEQALHHGTADATWEQTANNLVDALTAIWADPAPR
ncbi:TetR/AcrR family transcriptional regulator [Dactylosporangium sp. CA-233914]|uniref:TetR/AcrR family transcriptional regulator n=1 Tax=Dactylosporangium sp. CA-233914 TaxID=3239934 RepID=UPI003D8EEB7A